MAPAGEDPIHQYSFNTLYRFKITSDHLDCIFCKMYLKTADKNKKYNFAYYETCSTLSPSTYGRFNMCPKWHPTLFSVEHYKRNREPVGTKPEWVEPPTSPLSRVWNKHILLQNKQFIVHPQYEYKQDICGLVALKSSSKRIRPWLRADQSHKKKQDHYLIKKKKVAAHQLCFCPQRGRRLRGSIHL